MLVYDLTFSTENAERSILRKLLNYDDVPTFNR